MKISAPLCTRFQTTLKGAILSHTRRIEKIREENSAKGVAGHVPASTDSEHGEEMMHGEGEFWEHGLHLTTLPINHVPFANLFTRLLPREPSSFFSLLV